MSSFPKIIQIECAAVGARLVEVEDTEENMFLKNLARTSSLGPLLFLGGTEVFEEGSWIWYSTLKNISFTDWGPDKPDYGGTDFCLVLYSPFDYAWDDFPCGFKVNNTICERVVV